MHKAWPWILATVTAVVFTIALFVTGQNAEDALNDALVSQCKRVGVVKTYLRWEALAEGRADDVAVADRLLPLLDCEETVEQGHPVPLPKAEQDRIILHIEDLAAQ